MDENGIMTKKEQDKAIMELMAELKVVNNELKHTNANINKILACYEKTQKDIDEIKNEIIPPIKDELTTHGVWIKILSTAVLGAVGAYITSLFV